MARGKALVCPYCGAASSVSKGVRRTKTMGNRRIRLCKACGRKFTPKNQNLAGETRQGTREPSAQADPADKASREFYQAAEPAEALGTLFPPPDDEWTS